MVRPFCAKRTFLASLTPWHRLLRSYKSTTNLSSTDITFKTSCIVGILLGAMKALVALHKTSMWPTPCSSLVLRILMSDRSLWMRGKRATLEISLLQGPRRCHVLQCIYYCLPTPNAIHNLLICGGRKLAIASTTTSVSTVRRILLSIPCRAQSDACKMSLVSASSRVQGDDFRQNIK